MKRVLALTTALLLTAACGGGLGPAPRPSATAGPALSETRLAYALLDAFGPLAYCDPDLYPIARADEAALAKQHEGDLRADPEMWSALSAHHPIAQIAIYPPPPLTGEQLLPLYRDWKMLRAITLTPAAGGFTFAQRFAAAGSADGGRGTTLVEGAITRAGGITVTRRTASGPVNCPICLTIGTRIATPHGEVSVESLAPGMAVWTTDASGARTAGVVRRVGSTRVPETHEVVALTLSDGRAVRVSPGHPTADGRRVGDLGPGDEIDGAVVVRADRAAYAGAFTFDLLPSGGTGRYWANGVLLASTLDGGE